MRPSAASSREARARIESVAPAWRTDGLLLADELSGIHVASHQAPAAQTSRKRKVGHGHEPAGRWRKHRLCHQPHPALGKALSAEQVVIQNVAIPLTDKH